MQLSDMLWIIIIVQVMLVGLILFLGIKLRSRFQHQDKQFYVVVDNVRRIIKDYLGKKLENTSLEIQNAIYLNQLGLTFPTFLGDASIDTFHGKILIQQIMERRPGRILELGSGSSTVIISKCMQLMGVQDYEHLAVDHEKKYLDLTKQYARLNNVEDRVIFLECPLGDLDNVDKPWYTGLIEKLNGKKIDFVVVDGPPAITEEQSRYPALPLLYPYLSKKSIIILDDANRDHEQSIVNRWLKEYPEFKLNHEYRGKGIAVLTR